MKRYPLRTFSGKFAGIVFAGIATCGFADQHVVISATADPTYTAEKYEKGKVHPESYVIMIGHYFEGHTVDHSIDRMPFQKIVNFLAPELARREYWPAKGVSDADLLLVVHWGTTSPQASSQQNLAHTTPLTDTSQIDAERQARIDAAGGVGPDNVFGSTMAYFMASGDEGARIREFDLTDQLSDALSTDYSRANAVQLLGYSKPLRDLGARPMYTAAEATLYSDLENERYFMIIKAYSLRDRPAPGRAQKALWTLHLNMRAPGINFRMALDKMSAAAVDYFGRTTDSVQTITPRIREGKVEVGTPIVLAEKK